jgi:hypothetical protein
MRLRAEAETKSSRGENKGDENLAMPIAYLALA